MKKRVVSLFIAIIMMLTFIPVWTADAASIKGWSVVFNNGCIGSAEIDYNLGSKSEQSLKIVCESDKSSNVYVLLSTRVNVEEGKSYIYGGDVKSDNSSELQTMIDWGTRTSLLIYGQTFDFKSFRFRYVAEKTGSVQIMFLIEGKSDGIWFDNMFFMDEAEGENQLSNPDFEEEEEEKIEVADNEYKQKLIDINQSAEYSKDEAEKISSLFHNLPVFYKNITVDADSSDWEGINMAYMPIDEYRQLQLYAHDDSRAKDLKVDYAFAYDEDYFYMYYNVFDDLIETYDEIGTYWRGDSIQFMLSDRSETSGTEFGIIHDTKTDSGMILSSQVAEADLSRCIVSTKRVGQYTTYEAAIPWNIKYTERPKEFLFDFIINDNDYNGRAYCVQLAPGIAESKDNYEYPTLKLVDKDTDWFAWIDGEIVPNLNEESVYNFYLSNYGKDKDFTVRVNGEEKNIRVKSGRGFRETMPLTFTEEKQEIIKAEVVYEGKVYEITHIVDPKLKNPTPKLAKSYQREILGYIGEIEELINECEKKGISAEYEKVNLQTLKFYADFMDGDIERSDLDRINYTYRQLKDIYTIAKENLEGYLSGEKTAFLAPRYVGNHFDINGTTTYADTFDGEKYEKRPFFFVGYGHFAYAQNNLTKLVNLGVSSIQNEVGIKHVFKAPGQLVEGSFSQHGTDATCAVQTDVAHSGERALKITNKTPKLSDVYAYYHHSVLVAPNTKYKGSAWIKGKNASNICITTDGMNERNYFNVPAEWKKVEFTFTTKDDNYSRSIRLLIDGPMEEVYVDDISIKAEESDTELFADGGFEAFIPEGEEYTCSESGLDEIRSFLARAEDLNVGADILLSPHYMYNDFYKQHPEASTQGGGFIGFDVNHPAARKVVEDYLRFVIPRIRDYKSLNSICLTNEPTFRSNRIESYSGRWHDFLKEKHGSIEALNDLYGTAYSSFEEVEMPLNMGPDPACLDYEIFNDLQFTEWHIWMANIVRELAPGTPINFKPMPYINSYEESHARANMTHGTDLEYTIDAFDVNGCDSHNFLTNGAGNKIQTMWYDFQVSIKDAPVFDTEHHIMPDRYDKVYSDEYDAYAVTNVWQGAFHYRANSVLWAWQRENDKNSLYWGNITQRPKAVWGIGIATHDLNRLSYQVEAIQKEKTDIAILYSAASRMYDITEMNMIYETYDTLMCLGKKVKFVTEMQIDKMYNFDTLFVPCADYVNESTLDIVINYINNGGNVVLIGDDCFKYTEYMNNSDSEKRQYIIAHSTVFPNIKSSGNGLLGITKTEFKNLIRNYLKNQNKLWVEVLNAETGELCDDIEYTAAVCDDKLIVNVCNYGKDVDISLYLGDKKAEKSVELRSMTEQGKNITAKQYAPILLEVEADSTFIDTYGHWAEHKISEAYTKNLVSGMSRSRFDPDQKITRAQFVTMLIRASELRPEAYENVFADVSGEKWYAVYMQSAYKAGIIDGGLARPDDYITREEMCNMIVRAYERKNKAESSALAFIDASQISDRDSVSKAYGTGIIKGYEDNSFRPKSVLTRAEAVTVILNLYDRIG